MPPELCGGGRKSAGATGENDGSRLGKGAAHAVKKIGSSTKNRRLRGIILFTRYRFCVM
jgi:hypothetical protein